LPAIEKLGQTCRLAIARVRDRHTWLAARGAGACRHPPLLGEGRVFEFTATTREPKLWVLAKESGQMLGSIDLPTNATGSPMTYRVGNRQFIVIPIGGGGIPPS
jgi:quinoprotein glucose dehydrogenase